MYQTKGNTNAYPTDIHKALTLMNEYKPLKLDSQVDPAQGTAFVTGGQGGKKKGNGSKKYLKEAEWIVLSPEAQPKIIESCKKGNAGDEGDKSLVSNKSANVKSLSKTMNLLEKDNWWLKKLVSTLQKCKEDDPDDSLLSTVNGSSHFQDAMDMLKEHHPKIVLALKSRKFTDLNLRNVLLLDNQSTFDLCCNKMFAFKIFKAENVLSMMSNGGGLKIIKKCKIPGYKCWYIAVDTLSTLCPLFSSSLYHHV